MKLSKEFTTVTPLSKALALTLFIVLPIITFSLGMNYQASLQVTNTNLPVSENITPEPIACTMEAKMCPDGTAVGRVGPDCEFAKCPAVTNTTPKIFTGTITKINYTCHVDGECSIQIGKGNVIVEKSELLKKEVRGSLPIDLLNEASAQKYIGKQVEVYAAPLGGMTDRYTLYGSKTYYIKLINEDVSQVMCGGIAGKMCPDGYYCKYDGSYPDAAGKCIKTSTATEYACPQTKYVNCMPSPNSRIRTECTSAYLKWATANCPGFQGAAL